MSKFSYSKSWPEEPFRITWAGIKETIMGLVLVGMCLVLGVLAGFAAM